jgi:hypothetical protein
VVQGGAERAQSSSDRLAGSTQLTIHPVHAPSAVTGSRRLGSIASEAFGTARMKKDPSF